MSAGRADVRQARVRALAKINLALRVLTKRADGFHELRTIFQTISLADTLHFTFRPGRRTSIVVESSPQIPGNLVERAAHVVMDTKGPRGEVGIRLDKRIPMGAGLGGGSSDAAAVLLALPALTGRQPDLASLCRSGQELGSDVPFFLLGGAAVGVGRGSEVFPLPDGPVQRGVLVTPAVHVSTADAYRRLSPRLTTELPENKIFNFQSLVWGVDVSAGRAGEKTAGLANDFEAVVFEQHRHLAVLKKRLIRAGAGSALMTGSGSAVFGLFQDREGVSRAREFLKKETVFPFLLVTRARYRSMWWRALSEHINGRVWPPQSRYLQ